MRVGIIFAFMDYHRKGQHHRGVLQPQIGPLIAGLLPPHVQAEVVNDTWEDPDWSRDYDLLFISCLHSDFDRARQISHFWRRRGARTVFGGTLASTFPNLCRPYFDALVIGDPEGSVAQVVADFERGELRPAYVSSPYVPELVPTPRVDLLADKQVVPLSLEVTRGCPFTCEFCALTGLGTRHHVRPVELVVRDVLAGQRMLAGRVPSYLRRAAVFNDNNIGGNLPYLRRLCDALQPLGLRWGSAATFNVVADPDNVRALSRSGCRFLFMGLESFNAEAIADMHKYQNAIDKTCLVMDSCRNRGILVVSGLMLNPSVDDCRYIESVPRRLGECGLHVPAFICFEAPIPGTPHFEHLARQERPALLPDAYLRDFTGYTLVTRPKREPLDDFVAAYRAVTHTVFSTRRRLAKVGADGWHFLSRRFPVSVLVDAADQAANAWEPHAQRTFVAGTDVPPPEAFGVPLRDDDFDSEEERRAILDPWKVTDETGRVLPQWLDSVHVFGPRGRLSPDVLRLAPPVA